MPSGQQPHSSPSNPPDQDTDDEGGDDEAYIRKVGVKQGPHAYNKFNVRQATLLWTGSELCHRIIFAHL